MRTKALTADERRSTQIGMIRRLLFMVDYYQATKDAGTGRTDFHRVVIEAQSEICVNLRPSAVRFFLRSLYSFAAIPSFYLSALGLKPRVFF